MKILGIALQHDAGAALVEDGKIVAAVNEERLNREKMYWGIPELAIKEVLKIANWSPNEIDFVAIANLTTGNPIITFEDVWRDPVSRIIQFLPEYSWGRWLMSTDTGIRLNRFIMRYILPKNKIFKQTINYLSSLGINRKPVFVEHHNAHAASAYFTSGWQDKCLAVTLDAVGDGYCSKIFVCETGKMQEIHRIPFYHSPGYYYSYITQICDFRPGRHEGKITGLAAFGDPQKTIGMLRDEICYDTQKFSFINRGGYIWPEIWRLEKKLVNMSREDIAAGMQVHLEELVSAYISDAVNKTGIKKVAVAGGVFANVKMNQRIREINGVEGIWVHPHMGDGGLTVGAALGCWMSENNKRNSAIVPLRIKNVYYGPRYSNDEIAKLLKEKGYEYQYYDNVEQEIAKLIAQGRVVARFAGQMEYGPRALGNRSILYQATDPKVNDWLNKRLKRTEFMPFAPVLLEEDAAHFLQEYDSRSEYTSEFMTVTYNVTDRCWKESPAIVHKDGTARPQVVKPAQNPSYEKILKEYKKLTGLSILVNTSFNMHEEPIVCTPDDAIRAFSLGHLDYLAIENIIVKHPQMK